MSATGGLANNQDMEDTATPLGSLLRSMMPETGAQPQTPAAQVDEDQQIDDRRPDSPAAGFLRRKSAREGTQVGKASAPQPFDSDSSDEDTGAEKAELAARRRVWMTHDSGHKAMATLGTHSPHVTHSSLIYLLVSLLPVKLFAPDHRKWKGTPTASLPVFVSTFAEALPKLYQSIQQCATVQSGSALRSQMQSVVAELFGMFGDTVHSAFLYAVMIYIWCSSGSALSTMAQVLLVDYMQADHVSLSGFLDASKDSLAQAD